MDSPKEKIKKSIQTYAGGRYSNSVVEFLPDNGSYIIVIPHNVGGFAKRAKAMLAMKMSKEFGVIVDVIQESGLSDSGMMVALNELLEVSISENFLDVSASVTDSGKIRVIVFVKSILRYDSKNEELASLRKKVSELIALFGRELEILNVNEAGERTPSLFQIVRLLYIRSPINFDTVMSELVNSGSVIPSERWLKRQLDTLTKRDLVLWQRPGFYTLTEIGMSLIPRVKGKSSPDVARVLAFKKNGWYQ